jgi:hypothetical protein
MRKTIVCGLVVAVILVGAHAIRGRTASQEQSADKDKIGYDASRENDPTTIESMVRIAKARGLNRIKRGSPVDEPSRLKGVDDAIDKFSTIVVTPTEKTTQIQFLGVGLETIYRCKVAERVNLNKKAAVCCDPEDFRKFVRNIPNEGEIPEEEIYIRTSGGRVVIDGVEVEQDERPAVLEVGHTYLVFLAHDESAKIGLMTAGGAFEMEPDGRLTSKNAPSRYPNRLVDAIQEELGGSASRLKDRIQQRRTNINRPSIK